MLLGLSCKHGWHFGTILSNGVWHEGNTPVMGGRTDLAWPFLRQSPPSKSPGEILVVAKRIRLFGAALAAGWNPAVPSRPTPRQPVQATPN
jgi:hypothetical protein